MRRLRADARAHALNWCVQRRVCVCVTQARARSCVRCGGAAAQHTHTHTHTHTRTHKHTPGGPRRTGTCKVLTRYSRGAHTTEFSHRLNSAAVRAVTNIGYSSALPGTHGLPLTPPSMRNCFVSLGRVCGTPGCLGHTRVWFVWHGTVEYSSLPGTHTLGTRGFCIGRSGVCRGCVGHYSAVCGTTGCTLVLCGYLTQGSAISSTGTVLGSLFPRRVPPE